MSESGLATRIASKRCPYFGSHHESQGLYTCLGLVEWKDLRYKTVRGGWGWLCSGCGGVVRVDPWNPPADLSA